MKRKIIFSCCVYFLFFGIAFNITYWAMAKYDVRSDFSSVNDARYYIQMSQGNYEGVPPRYAKRFVLPEMVRLLNENLKMEKFLGRYYQDIEQKTVQMNFGLVNILFLSGAAFLFFLFMLNLGFSAMEGLLGGMIFLTSFFVVTYYTIPLVDSAGCFFVMACFFAIQQQNIFWLTICFLIGVFVKESTFVIVLASMLSGRKIWFKALLACLPGVLAYLFLSWGKAGGTGGYNIFEIATTPELFMGTIKSGISDFSLFAIIESVQLLGFCWIFFIAGLFHQPKPEFLRRQFGLFLLPLVVPFLVGESNLSRVAFYLFPIFLPIVMFGIRDILKWGEPAKP